jgi:hypothetical protein
MMRPATSRQAGRSESVQQRIGAIIGAYAEQGFHRTGTAVDLKSGEWLADEVRGIGLEPELEGFTLSRSTHLSP